MKKKLLTLMIVMIGAISLFTGVASGTCNRTTTGNFTR
ncbi:hypothetical protein HNP81_004349 [Peribacillus huizhouensis]|uniref:Uncharacterized protein n=1 Tax=Peribacillus huizhouensis TaxID=1501239 RepID=A0ABR6CVH3_9BACI|nr:hypothetical protein [Peribacillus huizhouensis]